MIIALDGAVATGKSTVAKLLAQHLGYIYFDTGAMYRALTWGLIHNNVDIHNAEALQNYLNTFEFDMRIRQGDKFYYVGETDVTNEIRTPKVTERVSEISAIPAVREKLVLIQQELSRGVNSVFEGRDMGTVVFPNADLKIFLTGDPAVRAHRRYLDLIGRFPEMKDTLNEQEVLEQINKRDEQDSSRAISPLKEATDAYILDTTDLSVEEVVYKILEFRDTKKRRKSNGV